MEPRRMTSRLLLVLAAAGSLMSGGCGGPRQEDKYRIAVIPKGLTHEFWQSIHRGADRAAADLRDQGIKVRVVWDGPLKENDALEQVNIVERSIGSRVHGIVLAPQHSETMVAPVERAVQQGIPVLIIDSGLARSDIIVKYVATNNYHGGWLAAEHLLKVLMEQGKAAPRLVLLRYQVGSESTEQREKGFEDYVNQAIAKQRKAGQPAITWVSTDRYAGATIDTAEREAGPLLTRLRDKAGQPAFDAIFAPNESSATGVLNALRSQNLNRKVRLMAFDSSEPLLQAIQEGDVAGTIVQDPYKMGYLGVWILVQHLEGHDVMADGQRDMSTGEYVLTKENLKEPATLERFNEDVQRQRTIVAPTFPRKR